MMVSIQVLQYFGITVMMTHLPKTLPQLSKFNKSKLMAYKEIILPTGYKYGFWSKIALSSVTTC